jgi:hypothetical protein
MRYHGPDNPAYLGQSGDRDLVQLGCSNCNSRAEANLLPCLAQRMMDVAPFASNVCNVRRWPCESGCLMAPDSPLIHDRLSATRGQPSPA